MSALATAGAWVSAKLSAVWLWLAGVAAALAVLAGVYASIRRGGRDAQRGDDAISVIRRSQKAGQARAEAAKPVTQQEEADDPFNRDRR